MKRVPSRQSFTAPSSKWGIVDLADWQHRHLGSSEQNGEDNRSQFERDRARILHSRAFRRLQTKTQVFAPGEADFYRTRLTHSLECAQIGRALALNQWSEAVTDGGVDLTEAACLAHDIGHPPFGHKGESALCRFVPFEGNAQTLRIITELEAKTPEDGLDLTRGTLASVIKYPVREPSSHNPDDCGKFVYKEEEPFTEDFILPPDAPGYLVGDKNDSAEVPRPFPLDMMEWADDVAYSTHDVEDGINAGFITAGRLHDASYREPILTAAMDKLADRRIMECDQSVAKHFDELKSKLDEWGDPSSHEVKNFLDNKIDKFVRGVTKTETGFDDWLYKYQLEIPDDLRIESEFLKAVAEECVFKDPRLTRLEYKGQDIVSELFEILLEDARSERPELFPREWQREIRNLHHATAGDRKLQRKVCDYIAGMSDNFCFRFYSQLVDPSVSNPFITFH